MRERKFKQYYIGSDGSASACMHPCSEGENINDYFYNCAKVHKVINVESIGLKDKRGIDIYEGDIINYNGDIWSVGFRFGAYVLEEEMEFLEEDTKLPILFTGEYTIDGTQPNLLVIGNIFENKELLCNS